MLFFNANFYLFIYICPHHVMTRHVIKLIWGIKRETTISVNNVYSNLIFDWLTLILMEYNNSKLFAESNDIKNNTHFVFCFIEHK